MTDNWITRRGTLQGLAGVASLPVFGKTAFAQSGQAVIYTSNNAQSVDAITDVGRKLVPNIKISTVTGGSGQLLRRIEAEAARPQADVFWSSSANTLGAFKQLFEAYKVKDAEAIPEDLRHPENLWTAANLHVAVLMVNTAQLGDVPAPKSYADILDARYKGKLIIADPASPSTALTILGGLGKMLGDDGLKALAKNIKVTPSASTVLRSVAQGEHSIGLTFESNAYAYVAGGQKEISLVYPADGTFTTPEFFALVKGAPSGDNARHVCDLLASKEAQIALLEAAFRRPARKDVEVSKHVNLPEIAKIKVFATDEGDAAKNRKAFIEKWAQVVSAAGN